MDTDNWTKYPANYIELFCFFVVHAFKTPKTLARRKSTPQIKITGQNILQTSLYCFFSLPHPLPSPKRGGIFVPSSDFIPENCVSEQLCFSKISETITYQGPPLFDITITILVLFWLVTNLLYDAITQDVAKGKLITDVQLVRCNQIFSTGRQILLGHTLFTAAQVQLQGCKWKMKICLWQSISMRMYPEHVEESKNVTPNKWTLTFKRRGK